MSDLHLYTAIPSRGMVTRWMLEEVGEPYATTVFNLDANEHKTAEYLKINPMGRVPALTNGDVVVTETAAICAYLADLFPAKKLRIEEDSPHRGAYLRWLFFGPVTVEPSIGWKMLGDATSQFEYQPFADMDSVAETLRGAVAGREFIAGGRFTAADVVIGSSIYWAVTMVGAMPAHRELMEYWDRLAARPAWKRARELDGAS